MESNMGLRKRLEKIWEVPNMDELLKNHAKRPPLKITKGQTIFYEGDQPERLFFITKGFVKLYHLSEEGKDSVIYLYGPGNILGIRALTSADKALKHNAEALTDVEIITVPHREFIDIATDNPEYLIDILHSFIQRLNYAERKLEGFITNDATTRLANFLSDAAIRFGQKKKEGISIPIPLTHQQIAEFVGSARETVTIALHKLAKEGIVKIARGKVDILNKRKLDKYSNLPNRYTEK